MRARWMSRAAGLTSIDFTGWIPHEQLQGHFHRSHIGLILLRGGIARFWLGNKIFEYLSAYMGLVNNVSGEPAEIVRTHELGLNVEAQNSSALARAIGSLVNDPPRVRLQMENAKKTFNQRFTRDAIQTEYRAHLKALMPSRIE